MFVGSEGTLGIITQVTLALSAKPEAVSVSFITLNSIEKAVRLLTRARIKIRENLNAFEVHENLLSSSPSKMCNSSLLFSHYSKVLDESSLNAVLSNCSISRSLQEQLSSAQDRLPGSVHTYVIMETCNFYEPDLLQFMHECFMDDIIVDSVISQSDLQAKSLWQIRETV